MEDALATAAAIGPCEASPAPGCLLRPIDQHDLTAGTSAKVMIG